MSTQHKINEQKKIKTMTIHNVLEIHSIPFGTPLKSK